MSETGRCILAVDDEPMELRLIKMALEPAGYQVVAAENGASAFALLKASRPDLVLLDIRMPGLDGVTVLALLRQLGDTPIIMLTGVNEEQAVRDCLELGADDFIIKPFAPRELAARIRAKLRRSKEKSRPLVFRGGGQFE